MLFQGQEVMPAWGGLVSALRSGRVPWEEAHPDDPGDFWDYMKVRMRRMSQCCAAATSSNN